MERVERMAADVLRGVRFAEDQVHHGGRTYR